MSNIRIDDSSKIIGKVRQKNLSLLLRADMNTLQMDEDNSLFVVNLPYFLMVKLFESCDKL